MRYLLPLFVVLLSFTACSSALVAQGTVILPDIVGQSEGHVTIAVESSDATIQKTGQRAFSLHGGCTVTTPGKANLILIIERASSSSVSLTLKPKNGTPQTRTVPGRDLQDAVLRACDLVVKSQFKTPGFFAGKLAFVGKQRGVSEIYSSNILFGNVRPLTRDRAHATGPSWSPDGSQLLYTTYYKTGYPDIYKINLSTRSKSPIATYKGTNTGGRFSPDGRQIAMALTATGNSEIWVADRNGKNQKRLTKNKSIEASPSWSPDGRQLVFTSDTRGKPQLYKMSANGGSMTRVPTNVSGYCAEPAWNPVNANQIAFTAAVSGGFQVFVYDSAKGRSKQITKGPSAIEPCWLSDGRHIVYTQRQGAKTRLMIVDTDSGQTKALHNPNFGDASSASFVL